MVATANMLIYASIDHDGSPLLYAVDKQTGEELGRIEIPGEVRYGMSSWMHDGHQYVILQSGSKLVAMALPAALEDGVSH